MSTTATLTQTQPSVLHLRGDKTAPEPETNPLDGWWRADKEGKIPDPPYLRYPPFYNKTDEESLLKKREWIKSHMALCFRMWGDLGFNSGVSGHITVKDPVLQGHYWMNPMGVHFKTMTASKLVLVGPDGYVSPHGAQLPINEAGFAIHSAIHKARPEVNAAAHCHSKFGKAWSVFGKPVDISNQDACYFYDNQGVYLDGGRIALAKEEGELIAKALGPKAECGILQNHGLLTVGETVDGAIFLFNLLEKQCEIQLAIEAAAANGLKAVNIREEDAKYTVTSMSNEGKYAEHQPEIEYYAELYPQALK